MKINQRGLLPLFLLWVGLALAIASPMANGQKNRSWRTDKQTGKISWEAWQPLKCGRCESKGKADCGTCNGGRKKLPVKCGECRGKKKANCRECYGHGHFVDPFVSVICDRCEGRGAFSCRLCGANGAILYSNGKTGAKCRACSKKGYCKCTNCKGKGFLQTMQPEGTTYEAANEAQLQAVKKIIKSLSDQVDGFTGRQEQLQKNLKAPAKSVFRIEKYKEVMNRVVNVFPQFKADVKNTISRGKKAVKHKEIPDIKKRPGLMYRRSAASAQVFLERHMTIIENCLKVFDNNRRQDELLRRRKEKSGG